MLLVSRRRRGVDIWPGFVDALSALLMVVIFVLLLFSFAQFLLSQVLDEQETELDVMYQRVVELTVVVGILEPDDLIDDAVQGRRAIRLDRARQVQCSKKRRCDADSADQFFHIRLLSTLEAETETSHR